MFGRTMISEPVTLRQQQQQHRHEDDQGRRRVFRTPKRQPRESASFVVLQDHSGSKDIYEQDDSFWTSRPVLAILFFLALAVLSRQSRFLLGVCAVFIIQAGIVLTKWVGFVASNPNLQECIDVTKKFIKFWQGEADRCLNRNDRARKAAVATFFKTFGTTQHVASRYLRARQKMVVQQSMDESARFLSNARS